MRKARWTLPLFLALTSCTQSEVAQKPIAGASDNLYPFAVGNEWVYSDRAGDKVNADRIRTILEKTTLAGKPAYLLLEAEKDGGMPLKFQMRSDDTGIYVRVQDGYTKKDAQNQILRFPVKAGDSWLVKVPLFSGGHYTDDEWTYNIRGFENIKVPAGSFRALRVDAADRLMDEADRVFYTTYWYAPGVGMVKYATGPKPGFQERVLALKSYRLK